jgi:hypothetical protein
MMARTIGRRGESIHGTVNGGGPTLNIKGERAEIRIHAK